jgi:AraC-like DNA-binding protein
LDVLILLSQQTMAADCMNLLGQLSPNARLVVTDHFHTAVRIATERSYQMVIFLACDEAFPPSWTVHDVILDSPTMILTKANGIHIQLINQWIEKIVSYPHHFNDNSLFNKSLDYIEENLCESALSLEMVASHIYVSRCHYSRIFQKYVGVGFKEYIIGKRIEKAKHLLEKGELITNVCFMVGYNDLTHFSRIFKRVTGVSPSAYRRSQNRNTQLIGRMAVIG